MWQFILQHLWELAFTGISGALTAAYRRLTKRIKAQEEERKAIKEGLLAILHDRLYQACQHFMAQGSIESETERCIPRKSGSSGTCHGL